MDVGKILAVLVSSAVAAVAQSDAASDVAPVEHVYHVASLEELDVVAFDGPSELPIGDREALDRAEYPRHPGKRPAVDLSAHPRAVIDGQGEVVACFGDRVPGHWWPAYRHSRVAIRLAAPRDVVGLVFVPAESGGHVAVPFRVPADAFTTDARAEWLDVLGDRAELRLAGDVAGASWWRSRAEAARRALGDEDGVRADVPEHTSASDLEGAFGMFSGGRALSERLALDRMLAFGDDVVATVPIAELDGVEARDDDRASQTAGRAPQRDLLASSIPADQHAVFLPSLGDLVDVVERLDETAASIARFGEQRSQSADTRARYERQLGLPLDARARGLGDHVVGSVAVTGGDPYYRTGTDVAVLLETRMGAASRRALIGFVSAALEGRAGVVRGEGEVRGVAYTSWRSADRGVCSYVAALDGAVVVTNSPVQLDRVVAASRGDVTSLDALDEYTAFRERYERDDGESALLVVSGATVRRWAGPRVRIGSSRRARAAAVLGEVTARAIDGRLDVDGDTFATPDDLPDAGTLALHDGAVVSSTHGSLAFATPIAELDLDSVSEEEADLYDHWRRGYVAEGRVADAFAARLVVSPDTVELDTTVLRPRLPGRDLDGLVDVTKGGRIEPYAGDIHDGAVVHVAFALDLDGLRRRPEWRMIDGLVPGVDLVSWIGSSMTYSIDRDPGWAWYLATRNGIEGVPFAFDLPFAVQFDVGSSLRLAAFLTAMRGLVEQTAPNATAWHPREHEGTTYTRVSASDFDEHLALYYVTQPPGSFTLTASREIAQQTIERHLARAEAARRGEVPDVRPWCGEHVAVRVDVAALAGYLDELSHGFVPDRLREASWRNIPILDEWRRRFPDADPLDLHERRFARRLLDPSGGRYVWNDAWQTHESTAWGRPGAPRWGPAVPPVMRAVDFVHAGVTFEDDALRAKLVVELGDDAR